jgi:hypothetical protein
VAPGLAEVAGGGAMKTSASMGLGAAEITPSGLGKAIRGCVVWLQLDGGPTAGGATDTFRDGRRRVCPYEGACTEQGRCYLPRRPRC